MTHVFAKSTQKLLAALAATSLIGASACSSGSGGMESVKVAWLPITQTLPFYVAMEEGLFEAQGIKIEHTRFEKPNQIVDALTAGQVEVGAPGTAAGIVMLAESKFPGTFKIFGLQGGGGEEKRINDALVVRKDSEIQDFKNLRGKTVGTVPGIQWETITRHILRKSGLDPDKDVKVTAIGVSVQIPSVINHDVDATLSLEPVGSVAENEPELRRAVVNPAEQYIANPFYSGASVFTTKFVKERPDVAHRMVKALDEATAMINKDFEAHKNVLAKYAAIKPDQLAVVAQPRLRGFADINERDLQSYQALVDVFYAEKVLKKHIDVREHILTPADLGQPR